MKISVNTITRTIVAAVVLLNSVLAMTGHVPLDLDENTIYTVISGIATVGTTIWVWWKNNSFSAAALIGDKAKEEAKKTMEE